MENLFEHQKVGIAFLETTKKAILADEPGLGKTRQAIIAAGNTSKGTLIMCPSSVKLNWKKEIQMVYPGDNVVVFPDEEVGESSAWYVINYDILEKYNETIFHMIADGYIDTLIMDEAHYIKGSKAKRSKLALKISKGMNQVYELTGTPIMNRPIELFNLLAAIDHPIAKSWYWYAMRYCGAWRQTLKDGRSFLNVNGATHIPELRESIKDAFLRREKKEVLDLPEKIISHIPIEMSDQWRKKYDGAFDDYLEFLKENPPENMDNIMLAKHLVEIQKMKQVCSQSKIDRIVEDVKDLVDSGEKVVIFTSYKKTLEILDEELHELGVVTLSGVNTAQERDQAVTTFQIKDYQVNVFIGNIEAAGIGITLTASTKVIFADLDWTPAIHEQAEDRCHRIGQAGTVNVYYYIAKDTIEDDIVEMLEEKKKIIKEIMDGTKENVWRTSVAKDLISKIGGVHNSIPIPS